jgi:hypothetical protein
MRTSEHVDSMAEMAIEILFSEGDIFKGRVDKNRLQWEIRQATLKKLVTEDDDVLTDEEFDQCVSNSTIKPQIK